MRSFKPQNPESKYARVMLLGKNLVDNWFRTLPSVNMFVLITAYAKDRYTIFI